MPKKLLLIIPSILLQACAATSPSGYWAAFDKVDDFTDIRACSVSVGSLYYKDIVATYSGNYYPYIEVVNGDLRLGIKSGGKISIPVGDIQIRVDSNPAWIISSSETPLDYVPEGVMGNMKDYAQGQSEANQKIFESTYKVTMENISRTMSPFTATTGEKARSILKEMVAGQKIKYRTVGLNQAASTTGEYDLDPSFKASLSHCGIEL